jgi:hypothetical protein
MKKYIVTRAKDERETLGAPTSKGKHKSQKILNALILLGCDEGEYQVKRSTNEVMPSALSISMRKIDRVKKRFVEEGIEIALNGRKGSRIYAKKAEKITLVMDNLNTHVPGSFYEMFPPDKAKTILDRFEFVYTPKHGSWLNMAEIELNVLTRQCLNRRIDDIGVVRKEVLAWHEFRNNKNAKVNWQFTSEDARIKLSRLYPTLES